MKEFELNFLAFEMFQKVKSADRAMDVLLEPGLAAGIVKNVVTGQFSDNFSCFFNKISKIFKKT